MRYYLLPSFLILKLCKKNRIATAQLLQLKLHKYIVNIEQLYIHISVYNISKKNLEIDNT